MSASVRRSCWAGAVAAAAFSATLAIGLLAPGIAAATPVKAHTTTGQVPSGSNGVNHNDTPLPPNPNCTTTPGTSGTCSSPQPLSTADQNNVGANTTSSANAYVSTRNGAASDNGSGNGTVTGKPCAGCVGKADNKFPPGQAPSGPTDHNNGYECDGNNGIGQTNPAHTGCQAAQVTPPPKCEICPPPPPPPCQCPPPPTCWTCPPPPQTNCTTGKAPGTASGPTSSQVSTGGNTSVGASASTSATVTGAVSTGAQASIGASGSVTTGVAVPTSVSGTTGSATTPGSQASAGGATASPSVLGASGTASPSASVLGASGTATAPLAATASPSSGLAFTGFSAIAAAASAAALVAGGLLLVRAGRRRMT